MLTTHEQIALNKLVRVHNSLCEPELGLTVAYKTWYTVIESKAYRHQFKAESFAQAVEFMANQLEVMCHVR